MNVLLFIVAFLVAIDQYAFTHILHRPIVACSLIGLALGDVSTGIVIGGTLELFTAYASIGNTLDQTDGSLFVSLLGTILVINGGLDSSSAMTVVVGFWILGKAFNTILDMLTAMVLPMSRNAAQNRKSLTLVTVLPLILRGIVFGVLAIVCANLGTGLSEALTSIDEQFGWFIVGLGITGRMMPFIGLAVLLRNIDKKDMEGALYAGIATAAIASAVLTNSASLLVCALIAFGIGTYDFHNRKNLDTTSNTTNSSTVHTNTKKGGGEKWW